jgi:acetoacetyl-CoA synthetase
MYEIMTRLAAQHGFATDWSAFHRWTVQHKDLFWHHLLEWSGIECSAPMNAVLEGDGMLGTRWFPGMKLNFARHLLRFSDDRAAIASVDELGRARTLSYAELNVVVARLAESLRAAGVTRGDRVAGFLPNIPEAIIGMLATVSLGAIWSSCSPDFGLGGVVDRFGQIAPKVLIAANGYSYNGKSIDLSDRIQGILQAIPEIEQCLVVEFAEGVTDSASMDRCVGWDDFLGSATELAFEEVAFDHPLYIMYSSGTTGVPKCIVHGHGGTLLQHMKELMLHCDLRRDDTIFYFTTCGWMMWNWLVSSLGVGATVVLYEGSPFAPDNRHLWRVTETLGINIFGTSPKFLSACQKAGLEPMRQHDLSSLRTMLSTGAPLTVENFDWVYRNVGRDLQLASICGGTDIISCFMLGNPILPVYAGEIQSIGLGMDVQAWNEHGQPVVGEKGELVCCSPFPSQPTGFWNDEDGEKYRSAYFDHFPGVWRHGDFVEITEHGGVIVFGRSDATLNPGGVRIGTAEIYRQVEALDEIVDSVVVGKRTTDEDVDVCLFVVLREGMSLNQGLVDKIKGHIRATTTPRHVPRKVRQVSAVPYTISGKKVEMAVSQMVHGENVANRDALANPEALDQYAGIV